MSLPYDRAVAIIRDNPSPASQAENVSIISGDSSGEEVSSDGQRLRLIKIVNIIPSRQSRAERRCMR